MFGKEYEDMYMKAMFGQSAIKIPTHFFVQNQGDGVVIFAGAARTKDKSQHPLRYGGSLTHQMVVGEIIVRPHIVVESDKFKGSGITGLLTSSAFADLEEWLDGKVLVDNTK